jgi:hypothetical protein
LSSLTLVAAVVVVVAIVPGPGGSQAAGEGVRGSAQSMGVEMLTAGFSDSDFGLGRSATQFHGRRTGSASAPAMLGDPGTLLPALSAVAVLLFAFHPRRDQLCVRPAPRGPPLA